MKPQTPLTAKEMEVIDIESSDDTLVKPLKMLAQICVDELNKCNEIAMQSKNEVETENAVVEVSSESDSDTSSIRSSQHGLIVGGAKRHRCSESESSCSSSSSSGSDSSDDSSSSESEDSTDHDEDDNKIKIDNKKKKLSIDQTIVNNPNNSTGTTTNNDENENVVEKVIIENGIDADEPVIAIENEVEKCFSPTSLKDICRKVLHDNCIDILYEVPSLRYLCEHTLASAGMEIPLICFVNEEEQSFFVDGQQESQDEDERVFFCLNGEFDETELANLFNGTGVPPGNETTELLETEPIEPIEPVDTNASTLIDQCVALENILSSPAHDADDKNRNDSNPAESENEIAYFMDTHAYTVGNEFHDSIQYE